MNTLYLKFIISFIAILISKNTYSSECFPFNVECAKRKNVEAELKVFAEAISSNQHGKNDYLVTFKTLKIWEGSAPKEVIIKYDNFQSNEIDMMLPLPLKPPSPGDRFLLAAEKDQDGKYFIRVRLDRIQIRKEAKVDISKSFWDVWGQQAEFNMSMIKDAANP